MQDLFFDLDELREKVPLYAEKILEELSKRRSEPARLLVVGPIGAYIARMWISRRTAQIVLTLCLLVLQAQLLAASLLGCRHASGGAESGIEIGCSLHAAGATQDVTGGSEGLLDCPKCALQCAVGVYAPFAVAVVLADPTRPGQPAAVTEPHFYRFAPESDFRPPIARFL